MSLSFVAHLRRAFYEKSLNFRQTSKAIWRTNDLRVLLRVRTHETDSGICCSLIGQKNAKVFCAQSGARTGLTVRNYSGETFSPGASRLALDFSSPTLFFHPFRLSLAPASAPGSPRMANGVQVKNETAFHEPS